MQPGSVPSSAVSILLCVVALSRLSSPQMSLSPVRQAELHSDLKIQEKDELHWKKLKAEGLDENGEREAQLRRNFHGEFLFFLSFVFKLF